MGVTTKEDYLKYVCLPDENLISESSVELQKTKAKFPE